MDKVFILGGLRSYIGVKNSAYRHVSAEHLGAAVLKELTARLAGAGFHYDRARNQFV